MKKHLFSATLLLGACLLPGCATEAPAMRAGIQQPLDRHPKSFWQSTTAFPRDLVRSLGHAADNRTEPTNDSL